MVAAAALPSAASIGLAWHAWHRAVDAVARHERDQILAVATVVARSLSGDAHAWWAARLPARDQFRWWSEAPESVRAQQRILSQAAETTFAATSMVTLRLRDESRQQVQERPDLVHADAMEFLLTSAARPRWRHTGDYRPQMAVALFEGRHGTTDEYEDSRGTWLAAYVPIWDGEGRVVGMLEVDTDARGGLAAVARQGLTHLYLIGLCALTSLALVAWLLFRLRWHAHRRAAASMARTAEIQATNIQLVASNDRLLTQIEQRHTAEKLLEHLALYDTLTDLPNRALLVQRIERCLERARRKEEYRLAVLFLDIDDFKLVNDSLGHDAGDELLIKTAKRLDACVRGLDTVIRVDENLTARLGGDEFVILLDGIHGVSDAVVVAERIKSFMIEPILLEGNEIVLGASIGITCTGDGDKTVDDLLREADTAMYRAKVTGRGRHAVFDKQMHDEISARLTMENELRSAVERREFELAYQPIFELESRGLRGFEALVRWNHPERGVIQPDDFISLAEDTGLIIPLGRWIFAEACRQLARWNGKLATADRLFICINVSKRQLAIPAFVEDIRQILRDTDVDAGCVNLEITESVAMDMRDVLREVLRQVKELGLKLYLDDFGTGHSSLNCLHTLPIDVLKIDRTFCETASTTRRYAAVIDAIIRMAHFLEMKVTCEGLETADHVALMIALECDYGQGFIFSKPLNPADAWDMVAQHITAPRKSA